MAYKVTMPRLSDTMEEGKIIKWLKKEGDKVSKGEMLAEVETDKANLEMESFSSGILRKIIVKEGESASLGGLLAIIGEEGEDISGIEKEAAGKAETKEEPAGEEEEQGKEAEEKEEKEEAGAKPAAATEEKKKPEEGPVKEEKEKKETKPTEITLREALNQAMREEMKRDEKVFLMGEEVGFYDGAYKVSKGLMQEFGEKRVIDTPITEAGFTGIGIGAAMAGLRPIIEMMTFNFSILALDQIVNNAAKMRYMSGGQFKVPMVIRGPSGAAHQLGAQHSQALEAWFAHVPGLYVVIPSTPYDAKGLLKSAIRDDNIVIFMESELMYGMKGEVPEEEYLLPLGKGDIKKEGKDVTVIAYSKMLHVALQAAEELEKEDISIEVIDPRTIKPLDKEMILGSVKKTNRCVIVQEGWRFCGVAAEIANLVYEEAFDYLDAPVARVTSEDVPMAFADNLEKATLPSKEKVVRAVKDILYIK